MLGRTRLKRRFFLDGLLWLFLLEFGIMVMSLEPGFLDFDNLPDTNFTCVGKVIGGYYADLETNCQMFHVCTIGQENEPMDIRFLCLNGTVFDQETRVCERIDEVDCTKSEQFYSLNLELYGNSQPAGIPEDTPEDSETERPLPKATTTTTTRRPSTTKINKRPPPYFTTTNSPLGTTALPPQSGKNALPVHHFSSVSSTDIRFNPEEINISLNAGAPPDIRTKHHQPYKPHYSDNLNLNNKQNNMFSDISHPSSNSNRHSQQIFSDNPNDNSNIYSDNSNRQVTAHSSQYSDLGNVHINHEDSTTQTSKSVFNINHGSTKLHSTQSDLKELLNSGKFANPDDLKFDYQGYQTESPFRSQIFRFNNPDNYKPSQSFLPQISEDVFRNKQATITYHPPQSGTTIRTIYLQSLKPPNPQDHSQYHQHQTEKPPQRVQIPIPVLPTLPPFTFSSPAPFTLTRHIDAKRYTKDHPSPPRIIISASASVTDDSGRRLNYSLGTIGAAQILDSPPASYDDYKDGDVGLDPFYHDVPKLGHRRRKRNVEFEEDSTKTKLQSSLKDNKSPNLPKMDFKHLEMLKNPKDIEELLRFFGTIKDEKDLDRLLAKRSADPQQPQTTGKINVFDIIRNEKEAVEVLKFLFTWYKSHQATATAPPITIPVSPEIISRINYEFAPQDSISDSSEQRFTTRIRDTSTRSPPTLFTPKNIPVMYLDYLDGIKIETKDPKYENNVKNGNGASLDNFETIKNKYKPNDIIVETNNPGKPFTVNKEPSFDVNDYVNDNYEPEVLKYWGKQSDEHFSNQDLLSKVPTSTEYRTDVYLNKNISESASDKPSLGTENLTTLDSVKVSPDFKSEPFKEAIPLPTLFPPQESLLRNSKSQFNKEFKEANEEPSTIATILLPPKESVNALAKEILVQNYYLTSTDDIKSSDIEKGILTENSSKINENSLSKGVDHHTTIQHLSQSDIESNGYSKPYLNGSTLQINQENDNQDTYNEHKNILENTQSQTEKTTSTTSTRAAMKGHRSKNQNYLNDKIKEGEALETTYNETTTSSYFSKSSKTTKKYRRITTTRPSRGRSRFASRKTTATPTRTTEKSITTTNEQIFKHQVANSEIKAEVEITTLRPIVEEEGVIEKIRYNNGLPYSNLEENLFSSTTHKIKLKDQIEDLETKREEENQTAHLSLLDLKNVLKNDDNDTFYTEHPLNIEIQPAFEIQKVKHNNKGEDAIPQTKNNSENLKILTEFTDTTEETVVPIFYKKRNRLEFEQRDYPKGPTRNIEIVLEDDTTTNTPEITTLKPIPLQYLIDNTKPNYDHQTTNPHSVTYPYLDDTTMTTPVVSYKEEDILASSFPSATKPAISDLSQTLEPSIPELTQTMPQPTTQKSNIYRTRRPISRGKGKSRFAMPIQHHSIKKQLISEVEDEQNVTTTQNIIGDSLVNINQSPSPKLLLEEYIFATTPESITKDPLEISIPLNPNKEYDTKNVTADHKSKTKIELVGTNFHIKNLLLKEKSDSDDDEVNKKRGRKKFLDYYSTTTLENVETETKSAEVPRIPYEALKTNNQNVKYNEETMEYETTTFSFEADVDPLNIFKEKIRAESKLGHEENAVKPNLTNKRHNLENIEEKLTTVPQILKYLFLEIETTTSSVTFKDSYDETSTVLPFYKNIETTTLRSIESTSSNAEPENFFLKISKMEENSKIHKTDLMDTTEIPTTETIFSNTENNVHREKYGPSDQQMEQLKNSSHLVQVLVENSTNTVETTSLTSSTAPTTPQYYTRRTRPPRKRINVEKSRPFGRHRFSTELFTRSPIDVTRNEIESNDRDTIITDAPLHKSVPPTSEVKKISGSTPHWRRSFEGSSKNRVSSNYVFNCFGKELNTFYSDPRDCRLFHYCTQGYSKNQLLDLKYVCDQQTYFDDEKLICSKDVPQRCL